MHIKSSGSNVHSSSLSLVFALAHFIFNGADSTMTDGTVKFNVGGRHFEVSRALIDAHADTMLGKLVSDTWNDDPGKAVFVDRDGDIFAQILNYLRYGSIELPITIPRSMFDRELDYFGIASAEGITDQLPFHKTMDEFKMKFRAAKMSHDLFFLAYECQCKIYEKKHKDANIDTAIMCIPKKHMFYDSLLKAKAGGNDRKLFDNYLESYFGLMVTAPGIQDVWMNKADGYAPQFTVQMKKRT